jgi:hypothetical protein
MTEEGEARLLLDMAVGVIDPTASQPESRVPPLHLHTNSTINYLMGVWQYTTSILTVLFSLAHQTYTHRYRSFRPLEIIVKDPTVL